jgi:hypothetical protein
MANNALGFTEEEILPSRLFLAGAGDKDQEVILDKQFNYDIKVAIDFSASLAKEKKARTKKTKLNDYIKRWEKTRYHKSFAEAVEQLLRFKNFPDEIRTLRGYAAKFNHCVSF